MIVAVRVEEVAVVVVVVGVIVVVVLVVVIAAVAIVVVVVVVVLIVTVVVVVIVVEVVVVVVVVVGNRPHRCPPFIASNVLRSGRIPMVAFKYEKLIIFEGVMFGCLWGPWVPIPIPRGQGANWAPGPLGPGPGPWAPDNARGGISLSQPFVAMVQDLGAEHAGSYSLADHTLDHEEPQWESLGFRRDLEEELDTKKESTLSMRRILADRLCLRISSLGGSAGDDYWNIEMCEFGLLCNDSACYKYHHIIERRCRKFVLLGVEGCQGREGGCPGGLHVKAADVCQTYELNLMSTEANLVEAARRLGAQSPDKRATYVRFAVWGFATVRVLALRLFLAELPLLHELVLPDRDHCPFHLLSVIRLVSGLSSRCPNLLSLVFRDGTVEDLWNPGASWNQTEALPPWNRVEASQSPSSTEWHWHPWRSRQWRGAGDWYCPVCFVHDYANRGVCRRCGCMVVCPYEKSILLITFFVLVAILKHLKL